MAPATSTGDVTTSGQVKSGHSKKSKSKKRKHHHDSDKDKSKSSEKKLKVRIPFETFVMRKKAKESSKEHSHSKKKSTEVTPKAHTSTSTSTSSSSHQKPSTSTVSTPPVENKQVISSTQEGDGETKKVDTLKKIATKVIESSGGGQSTVHTQTDMISTSNVAVQAVTCSVGVETQTGLGMTHLIDLEKQWGKFRKIYADMDAKLDFLFQKPVGSSSVNRGTGGSSRRSGSGSGSSEEESGDEESSSSSGSDSEDGSGSSVSGSHSNKGESDFEYESGAEKKREWRGY